MPKRRSLWPLTWLPRPRTNRPFELACRSQAWLAITVGLRGKATAIDGVSSMRSVASAANASGVKTSWPSSTVISASNPVASADTPNGAASRQCLIGSIAKTRIPVPSTLRRGNRIIAAKDARAKEEPADDLARLRNLRARRRAAAIRVHLAECATGVQDLWPARCRAWQCDRLPDLLWSPACRHRVAHPPGSRARPGALFYCHPEHVRQRPVFLAEQRRSATRSRPLSGRDGGRQCAHAAPTADRAPRHRTHRAGLRLVDGRPAGLSLGGALSRNGGADRRRLRQRANGAAQFRFPRRHQIRADGRSGMARRLFRRAAGARIAGNGPDLCRLGIEPSLLPRRALAYGRLFLARGFSDCRLGGQLPAPRRQ